MVIDTKQFNKVPVRKLTELRNQIDAFLGTYSDKQKVERLKDSLCPVTYEWLCGEKAGEYTPPSVRKRFAGGFFFTFRSSMSGNSQSVYAKTKTGILYKFDYFGRRWKKVPGQ